LYPLWIINIVHVARVILRDRISLRIKVQPHAFIDYKLKVLAYPYLHFVYLKALEELIPNAVDSFRPRWLGETPEDLNSLSRLEGLFRLKVQSGNKDFLLE
jgi:hypothetical protein